MLCDTCVNGLHGKVCLTLMGIFGNDVSDDVCTVEDDTITSCKWYIDIRLQAPKKGKA